MGMLMGMLMGNSAVLPVGWCIRITLVGFVWVRALYTRDPAG